VRQLRWRANITERRSLSVGEEYALVLAMGPARVCKHALPVLVRQAVAPSFLIPSSKQRYPDSSTVFDKRTLSEEEK
jgi:hypothetical protein